MVIWLIKYIFYKYTYFYFWLLTLSPILLFALFWFWLSHVNRLHLREIARMYGGKMHTVCNNTIKDTVISQINSIGEFVAGYTDGVLNTVPIVKAVKMRSCDVQTDVIEPTIIVKEVVKEVVNEVVKEVIREVIVEIEVIKEVFIEKGDNDNKTNTFQTKQEKQEKQDNKLTETREETKVATISDLFQKSTTKDKESTFFDDNETDLKTLEEVKKTQQSDFSSNKKSRIKIIPKDKNKKNPLIKQKK